MKKYLPESIINHKKQGFEIPIEYWFKDNLKEYVHDTLLSNSSRLNDYLNKSKIKYIVENSFNSKRAYHHKIWSLLFLESWLENACNN